MSGLVKGIKFAARKSTGIVGLARNTNPLPGLTATYNATLEVLGGMPADAAYRKNVEILTNDRLSTVTSTTCVDTIEETIGMGQIEQLQHQADCELDLAQKMAEWKPWEALEEAPEPKQWKFP
eukprot:gene14606-34239_t